jgi:hypothetical protein
MHPTSDALQQDRSSRVVAESLIAYVRDASTMQQLYRIAEHHGRLPRDSFEAREVVTDVIEDIYTGEAKCNAAKEIAPQVERHVRRRARRRRKANRAGGNRRGPPRPDLVALDEAPTRALVAEPPEDTERDSEGNADEPAALVARVRELARDDGQALQLLALYDREIVARRDVLCSGMSEWVYRAARDRLARYGAMARAEAIPADPAVPEDAANDGTGRVTSRLGLGAPRRTTRIRRAARRALGGRTKLRSA